MRNDDPRCENCGRRLHWTGAGELMLRVVGNARPALRRFVRRFGWESTVVFCSRCQLVGIPRWT